MERTLLTAVYTVLVARLITGARGSETSQCDQLLPPHNGNVSSTKQGILLDTRYYVCDAGYSLNGAVAVACLPNGTWSAPQPTCTQIECPQLSPPMHGSIASTASTAFSVVVFGCDPPYSLTSVVPLVCLSSGQWSSHAPLCQANANTNCPVLSDPTNGIVSAGGTDVHATRTYFCNSGFSLEKGDSVVICLPSGEWSSNPPNCTDIRCNRLSPVANGRIITLSSTPLVGDYGVVMCDSGFQARNQSIVCRPNGSWTTAQCRPNMCAPLKRPANGHVSIGSITPFSTRSFTCKSGFQLIGAPITVCLSTGIWSTDEPLCKPMECHMVLPPVNGSMSLSTRGVGAAVLYSCNTGYILMGEQHATCQPTGCWSASTPSCQATECPGVGPPANGRVSLSTRDIGGEAEYSCSVGFRLLGEERATCRSTGQWSASTPSCQVSECLGHPTALTQGYIVGNSRAVHSMKYYRCNGSLSLVRDGLTVCLSNGSWSWANPACANVGSQLNKAGMSEFISAYGEEFVVFIVSAVILLLLVLVILVYRNSRRKKKCLLNKGLSCDSVTNRLTGRSLSNSSYTRYDAGTMAAMSQERIFPDYSSARHYHSENDLSQHSKFWTDDTTRLSLVSNRSSDSNIQSLVSFRESARQQHIARIGTLFNQADGWPTTGPDGPGTTDAGNQQPMAMNSDVIGGTPAGDISYVTAEPDDCVSERSMENRQSRYETTVLDMKRRGHGRLPRKEEAAEPVVSGDLYDELTKHSEKQVIGTKHAVAVTLTVNGSGNASTHNLSSCTSRSSVQQRIDGGNSSEEAMSKPRSEDEYTLNYHMTHIHSEQSPTASGLLEPLPYGKVEVGPRAREPSPMLPRPVSYSVIDSICEYQEC